MRTNEFSEPFTNAQNLFTQSNLTLALPNPLSSPLPPSPPLSCPRLHLMIFRVTASPPPDDIPSYCQVRWSPFDEHKMLLCDICNAGWHMDCLLPPFTTIPNGTWKCPLCTPRNNLSQTVTRPWHLRLPSPILDCNSD